MTRAVMESSKLGLLGVEPLAVAVALLGVLLVFLHKHFSRRSQKMKSLIEEAQRQRDRSVEDAEHAVIKYRKQNPSLESSSILSLSLSELTQKLQEGSLSAEDVFYSYMDKTLELQKKLNCCTGIITKSFEQIKTIDSCKKGLLFGVPVSVKENLSIKSQDASCGIVKFLNQPAQDDCVLVQVLKKQGAIPFVRTNVPQGLFSYECSNPVFGQTVNPHDAQRTCGGSSGGEAALIGGGGSVIGIGTDIGGSVRVPASFSGICSLKPTAGRLSSKGIRTATRGQKTVLSTAGPMGKDVESLALFMEAVLCDDMFSLDPAVPPVRFNQEVYRSRKPLTIGYYDQQGQIPITPSMARAVREVKALLEKAGHTLVPYKPVRLAELNQLLTKALLADGGATIAQQMKGSPIDPVFRSQMFRYSVPAWLKRVLAVVLKPLWPHLALTFRALSAVRSVSDLWKVQACIEDCVNDTIAEWRRLNIDVVLAPALSPAFNLMYSTKLLCMVPYTGMYNVLNFSAGVVPVTTVTEEDEANLARLENGGKFTQILKEAAGGALGLPVAVQCVALPWQDELCLRFMKEVETLARNKL